MKKTVFIAHVILILGSIAFADICIKEEVWREEYSEGKKIGSEKEGTNELWIGKSRVSYSVPGNTLIVDLDKNQFVFIHHKSKTYVEATLPLDMTNVLSERLQARFRTQKTTGTVKETGETMKIMEKECKAYEVNMQELVGSVAVRDSVITVWATTDLSFDWKGMDTLMENLRKIHNRDEKLRNELKKIKGIQMLLESAAEEGGAALKYVEKVVEMSEKEPPPSVYSVPPGYEKREKIESLDF